VAWTVHFGDALQLAQNLPCPAVLTSFGPGMVISADPVGRVEDGRCRVRLRDGAVVNVALSSLRPLDCPAHENFAVDR
jgi:hypothetical protein